MKRPGDPGLRLSVAIPVYNEEASVVALVNGLSPVLDAVPGGPHEIVFVDDGSTDRTAGLLESLMADEPRIVVVRLSRNFGHQAALSAALDHLRGDAVVLMDGDMQDRPSAIPDFLRALADGYDVAYAQRVRRKESRWLRFSYYMFYRVLVRLADTPMPLDSGDFCIMSRRVVDALRSSPERTRYLRGLRSWAGFRQIGIPVERMERHSGDSKYSLRKLTSLALDGIFSFSIVPLRAATAVGAISVALTTLLALYSLYVRLFTGQTPRGFTATILTITFVSGVNLFFLGVIGEYIGRIYKEVKGRPVYLVERVTRSDPDDDAPGR